MAAAKTIAALDIGSSKICCFIGEATDAGRIRVTGISHQASAGVKNGVIVDMEAAYQSILAAVHSAEQMAGVTMNDVVVSLAGGQPVSQIVRREVNIGGGAIREADINRLLNDGRQAADLTDRMLVHAIPMGYDVDDAQGITDPRGMHANRLAMRMHLVTARTAGIHNLTHCVNRCHLTVKNIVVGPYASGLSSLVEDERDLGATVIDMGGGTTSIAVFYEGAAVYTDCIPVGGIHVTSDIARGLSTSIQEAEKLKTRHGSTIHAVSDDREMLEVPQVGEEEDAPNEIPKSYLVSIISPRIEETLELVRDKLEASGVAGLAGQRVVLTGGACQLNGLRELATHMLDKQVRVGKPISISGLAEATGGPAFAAAAGLLKFAVDDRGEARAVELARPKVSGGVFARVGGWFRENF
ncbi:cell division protein FtsA [Aestuariispira ectoiniformans]|uniref:cell division protein FtsA n=1 Tax=Aestuariispira ectoiniformans TaxID=2775080 RepID=UPI00223AF826|nr:cell division protein FtsA [Aestuariispira ectoiniformans]